MDIVGNGLSVDDLNCPLLPTVQEKKNSPNPIFTARRVGWNTVDPP